MTLDTTHVPLLANELETFERHREELVQSANGKYALVHGDEVIGTYESKNDAITEGYRRFGLGPFLVKQVFEIELPVQVISSLLRL